MIVVLIGVCWVEIVGLKVEDLEIIDGILVMYFWLNLNWGLKNLVLECILLLYLQLVVFGLMEYVCLVLKGLWGDLFFDQCLILGIKFGDLFDYCFWLLIQCQFLGNFEGKVLYSFWYYVVIQLGWIEGLCEQVCKDIFGYVGDLIIVECYSEMILLVVKLVVFC